VDFKSGHTVHLQEKLGIVEELKEVKMVEKEVKGCWMVLNLRVTKGKSADEHITKHPSLLIFDNLQMICKITCAKDTKPHSN